VYSTSAAAEFGMLLFAIDESSQALSYSAPDLVCLQLTRIEESAAVHQFRLFS
jgi:hypothetical protein